MKNKGLFSYGKVFAYLTILLCFSPYYLIFFATTYTICLILFWFSSESYKKKITWSILPIVLGISFMVIINLIHHQYLKHKSLKLEIVLEENFEGEILIFDNIKCGQPKYIKNGRYILNVPENGVLYYSGDLTNEGYIDNIFKRKKGDSLIQVPNLNDSMFWKSSKEGSNSSYSKNVLGVFNVIHFLNHTEKLKPKKKFILTSKNLLDSLNWHAKIQHKLENLDSNPCK